MPDRLEMVVRGERQTALPSTPDVTSPQSVSNGFFLEVHQAGSFELPDHWIPFYMVNLQLMREVSQRFVFESGRELVQRIEHGDCVVVPPHEVRRFRFRGDAKFVLLSLETSFLQEILHERGQTRSPLELVRRWNGNDPVLRRYILRLSREMEAGCPGGPLLSEEICMDLATRMFEKHALGSLRPDYYKGGLSHVQLRRVCEYIDAALDTKLTTNEIANIVGLSKYHAGKAFKQSTGVPLHRYVLNRRVGRAQELLYKSELPLALVADVAGFSNQSHLTAVFSQRLGISPAAYRRDRRHVSIVVPDLQKHRQHFTARF